MHRAKTQRRKENQNQDTGAAGKNCGFLCVFASLRESIDFGFFSFSFKYYYTPNPPTIPLLDVYSAFKNLVLRARSEIIGDAVKI